VSASGDDPYLTAAEIAEIAEILKLNQQTLAELDRRREAPGRTHRSASARQAVGLRAAA
jgi:hypothetical protein